MSTFVNRKDELRELSELSKKRGLIVLYGRRRLGKTRLLIEWLKKKKGFYSQAIQATSQIQIKQIYEDIQDLFDTNIIPKSWLEFFDLLDFTKKETILCIDEFPYLAASDPSLPSIIQRWLDHRKNKTITLVLTGSSQRMMNDIFLNRNAPLYGRASRIINIHPMAYSHFCEALKLKQQDKSAFILYSLVGGVPRYWEFINKKYSIIKNTEELFFDFSAYLENEPFKLLSDEKIEGLTPINILEAIGRGAMRPSEIASRIGTKQTNLSRILQVLQDMAIIKREISFGESERDSKKSIYKIVDPAIRFWYTIYSPHRSRWFNYSTAKKMELITLHSSTVFEDSFRALHRGSKRYWEKDIEFDFVDEKNKKEIIIYEVKFKTLSNTEKYHITNSLENNFNSSKLADKYKLAGYEIYDLSSLRILQ
ncbi:ATP-binding protein [Candidatus Margulisiibacteriota bacterium]